LVTAPAWQLRDGDPPAAVPVEIGCGNCGHRYVVTDVGELHTELDAVVWHERCGTVVACRPSRMSCGARSAART
jgi:hypothetical protein